MLCWNAQERLREDPTGKYFPWQDPPATPRFPLVGFNLVDHSCQDASWLSTPLPRPLGKPSTFAPLGPTSTQDLRYTKEVAIAHGDSRLSHSHQLLGGLFTKKQEKSVKGVSAAVFFPAKERKSPGRAWQDRAPDNERTKKTST